MKTEPNWGPALDEHRALDPLRYEPIRRGTFKINGDVQEVNGHNNITFIGDEKTKYTPHVSD